jgi:hypothetical protein
MQCMAYLKMYNDMWIYREWNYSSGTIKFMASDI